MLKYELFTTDGLVRRGRMILNHGVVETPIFMPVGTYGAVRAMSPAELKDIGARIILDSTFHPWLRPDLEMMDAHKGLHGSNGWGKSILTDSGGFQVFSLSDLRKITEEGVTFAPPINGDKLFLPSEISMQIQRRLNSDIVMQFDEYASYKIGDRPVTGAEVVASMRMSLRWAQRSRNKSEREHNPNALLGIMQGGMFENLRDESLVGSQAIDADTGGEGSGGYAIGGLSVGEPREDMTRVLQRVVPRPPVSKPYYLMDVGTPEDLVAGVASGIDMLDCVMSTRNVRSGRLFIRFGDIKIKDATYRNDPCSLDETCGCYACSNSSRAYLHYLQRVGGILGARLNTTHNLYYYLELMAEMRTVIESHGFTVFQVCLVADRARGAL